MKVGLIIVAVAVSAIFLAIAIAIVPSTVDASQDTWRYDAYSRSVDIDICIRCDSPIPGPPGPQGPPGPPGPSKITVVTLNDDADGHAAGWNPPGSNFFIQAPFDIVQGMSIEATWMGTDDVSAENPGLKDAAICVIDSVNIITDVFEIGCNSGSQAGGAQLTYVATSPEGQPPFA
jgi:hypothetical protein